MGPTKVVLISGALYDPKTGRLIKDQLATRKEQEDYVKILSSIGKRVDLPHVVAVEVSSKEGVSAALQKRITTITEEWPQNMSRITNLILEGKVSLY